MTAVQSIVNAWRDEDFTDSMSLCDRNALPPNPAGAFSLVSVVTEAKAPSTSAVSGGTCDTSATSSGCCSTSAVSGGTCDTSATSTGCC